MQGGQESKPAQPKPRIKEERNPCQEKACDIQACLVNK